MSDKILMAPIQGVTDYHFRNTYQKFFEGVDVLYSPFLRLDKDMQLKKSKLKDVLPENNVNINLVPQILTNNSAEFIYLSKQMFDLGYKHLNWNLGCPFAMVINRELGSGLLPHFDKIKGLLEKVIPVIPLKLSIKMRIGLESEDDIFKILPILDNYPISEIIIHPRTGKQMYKGEVNTDVFEKCLSLTKHKVCYNGDINTLEDFQNLKNRFENVSSWMIGRGLVTNPFLAEQIKQTVKNTHENKMSRFKEFHDALAKEYLDRLEGSSHFLNKMRIFWEYFSLSFSNSHKVYKRIKKATSVDKYNIAVEQNCTNENWIV
ncbi:MAG: tRNA-dihydrouridine synthase family protein [Bacteroidales bacterium]|nr:tRNA-dihydrouridine synthase family protein [Bacteroidales bacterium]